MNWVPNLGDGHHQDSYWISSGFLLDFIRILTRFDQDSYLTSSGFLLDFIRILTGFHVDVYPRRYEAADLVEHVS